MVKISNPKQIKRLVELMEENPPLAMNFKRGVQQSDEFKTGWKDIAAVLNSLGPPIRDEKEWQKVWFDAKFKVKKKLIFNKKALQATGGGPFKQKYLSETDESISKLLSLNEVINPSGKVFGSKEAVQPVQTILSSMASTFTPSELASTSTGIQLAPSLNQFSLTCAPTTDQTITALDTAECFSEDETEDVTGLSPKTPSRFRKKSNTQGKDEFQSLLEKQIKLKENLYIEVKNSLKRIEDHLKDRARYNRKHYSLEEERLKLYKLQLEREEIQRIEENKFKMIDLEIKKRQLDIEEQKMHLIGSSKENYPNVE